MIKMADNATEGKIDQLGVQVTILTNQLSKQNMRLLALEKAWFNRFGKNFTAATTSSVDLQQTSLPSDSVQTEMIGPAETGSLWAGSGSFLARLATICFILVIALILRTLTDNGIIAAKTGSFIGTAYAAFLIIAGWRMMRQKQMLGSIFPVCGALLMYALVLETHFRFEAYTSVTAYSILLLTMLVLVIMGKHYQRALFYGVGVLGASCTAFAIDFPAPFFPQLALFLFAANTMTFFFKHQRARWVQVFLYIVTVLFWFLWAVKLHAPLVKGMETMPDVALPWFLPLTLLMIFTLMGFSVYTSFRQGGSLTQFDIILPTANAFWLYPACSLVVIPWPGDDRWLGYAGLALAVAHFIIAGSIFRFSRQGGAGICAYVFAGATLMVMATLSAVENILPILPFWGLVAVALSMASQACEIGGIRLTSYLLQCVATVFGITYGVFLPGTPVPVLSSFVAGSLAVMSAFQYSWSRKHPISCSIGFFAKVDPRDHSAVVLLVAALINGFCMIQLTAYDLIASHVADPGNALLGAQSTFINVGAISLMIFGLLKKNREILYTAIGIVVIGAFKALGYDLFKVHGIPLVFSVFSFGAAAAVGSVVLSRWSQSGHIENVT